MPGRELPPQPRRVDVQDPHDRPQPESHLCRLGSGDAATDDGDFRGRRTRHTAQQQAGPAGGALQVVGGGLDRHAAGNLAHRREQGQPPIWGLHGLVRDRVDAPVEEELGEPPVGRQVQVREQLLSGAESVILLSDGLLDLHDQAGGGEHLVRGADNSGAGRGVFLVREPAAGPSSGLHQDLPVVIDQLRDTVRLDRDPTFFVLDFLRHTNHQRGHTCFSLVPCHAAHGASTTLWGGAASSADGRRLRCTGSSSSSIRPRSCRRPGHPPGVRRQPMRPADLWRRMALRWRNGEALRKRLASRHAEAVEYSMAGVSLVQQAIDAVVDKALTAGRVVGAVVLVRHHGEPIYALAAGCADREAAIPMALDTVFRWASLTKPVVAATALALMERGRLDLDDPVTQFLPDFEPRLPDGSAPRINVRHLLTHTAGLGYPTLEPEDPYAAAGVSGGLDQPGMSMQENLRRIASAPLYFWPGSAWRYSMAIDVLGAIIAVVHGTSLADAVASYVTDPLHMLDSGFVV